MAQGLNVRGITEYRSLLTRRFRIRCSMRLAQVPREERDSDDVRLGRPIVGSIGVANGTDP